MGRAADYVQDQVYRFAAWRGMNDKLKVLLVVGTVLGLATAQVTLGE